MTSNRFRPPAMLAKIAATVDVVSGGRLDFGIGAGSRPEPSDRPARVRGPRPAVPRRRLRGRQPRRGVHGHPAAVDRGRAVRLRRQLRPAHRRVRQPQARPATPSADPHRRRARPRRCASSPEHADLWNIPGGDIDDAVGRSAAAGPLLRRDRPRPGRDHPLDPPAGLLRPARLHAGRDRPRRRRRLQPHRPEPARPLPRAGVARWVADSLIAPFTDHVSAVAR